LRESQNGSHKKCNFQPFIPKPAENTSGIFNNSNHPVETQVHKETRDPDDEDKDKDKDKDDVGINRVRIEILN
jgi:hypothetical protein